MTAYIRQILGPLPCQGCSEPVVYERQGFTMLGWLHPHGEYSCIHPRSRRYETREQAASVRKRYKRDWMRRKRAQR